MSLNQSAVVLFNHPGGEHKAKRSSAEFAWNRGKHQRKYLALLAHLALFVDGGFIGDPIARRVGLWGEFEPPTRGHIFPNEGRPGEPHSWHELLPLGEPPQGAQNTDPWVFGATFRYGLCRQNSIPYELAVEVEDPGFERGTTDEGVPASCERAGKSNGSRCSSTRAARPRKTIGCNAA